MTPNRYLFLNQMAGPLFRELAEDLAVDAPEHSELFTGHPDTLAKGKVEDKLSITKAPIYNRKNKFTRLWSWITYTFFALIKLLKVNKNTTVFIVSNPPLLGPVAAVICKMRRIQYIVLVYDMHPDTLISFGVLKEHSLVTRLWRKVNRYVWQNAMAVFTIGTVMAEKLAEQFDVKQTALGRIGVVPPWADTETIKPIEKQLNPLTNTLKQENCTTVLYSGNMGISHDIDSMLQAALHLKEENNIKFLFIGEGQKWQDAVNFTAQNNLTNVQVLPFQPEEKLPFTMALGDISLVALDKGAEGLMVPSKMYYYMAAGSAIIGVCQGRNDLALSLEQGDCGRVIAPNEPKKLATLILSLAADENALRTLKHNARQASVKYFSRLECMNNLKNALSQIQQ